LLQRFRHSVLAIPDCSGECQLVNIVGPKTPSQPRLRISPFCPVPSNWFAKMLAAQAGPRIDVSAESAHRTFPDPPTTGVGFLLMRASTISPGRPVGAFVAGAPKRAPRRSGATSPHCIQAVSGPTTNKLRPKQIRRKRQGQARRQLPIGPKMIVAQAAIPSQPAPLC
jgi:hypothetical protein